jgi:hypothetical protein
MDDQDVREVALSSLFQRLLGRGRAFPKEDSCDIPDHERFVDRFRSSKDLDGGDPKELMEWIDGVTPEQFDLAEAKRKLDAWMRTAAARGTPRSAPWLRRQAIPATVPGRSGGASRRRGPWRSKPTNEVAGGPGHPAPTEPSGG